MPKEHGLARGIARVLRRLYVRACVHVWRVSALRVRVCVCRMYQLAADWACQAR